MQERGNARAAFLSKALICIGWTLGSVLIYAYMLPIVLIGPGVFPPVDAMQAVILVGGCSIVFGIYYGKRENRQPIGLSRLLYLLFRFPCYIPAAVYFVGFIAMTLAFSFR
jgi:hypothetical protein